MRGALVATMLLAACGRAQTTVALPAPDLDPTVSCEADDFPASIFDEPGTAESEDGAAEDALRATIEEQPVFSDPPAEIPANGWREIARASSRVAFVAGDPPALALVVVEEQTAGRWSHTDVGGCRTLVRRDGLEPGNWALDPAAPRPDPTATAIPVLVEDPRCHGDAPVVPRLQEPEIRYGDDVVTIALYFDRLSGAQTCPGIPAERAMVELAEPLGDRRLLDGGRYPAVPGEVGFALP